MLQLGSWVRKINFLCFLLNAVLIDSTKVISAQPVLSRHLSDILFHFILYISNYQGNLVIAIFTPFLFLCSICQWNLISAVFCHRLIVWNKLHFRKNGERLWGKKVGAHNHCQIEHILQALIVLKYLPKVWERKRRADLKRLSHLVQVPGQTPGTSFHVTKFKFCRGKTGSCSGLVWLLRMGQNHKGHAWIYICSVLLLLHI